jgi:LPPG:FO 2-phospho-L-lactate transferase
MIDGSVVLLCGGVGGSKLADGMAQCLPPGKLTIVVNTADDFDHLGLRICPDLDTVTYMLAALVDPTRGWGRGDESWNCMEVMRALGGDAWFQLGDKDIALHLLRTQFLKSGCSLSEVTALIAGRLGIQHSVVPMSEQRVATKLTTDEGELSFQDYFVRQRCEPVVSAISYNGIGSASPSLKFIDALEKEDLRGIFIAPSNPLLSIGPILALPGIGEMIQSTKVPVIAVSPLIGGQPVKGPAAKLLKELGYPAGTEALATCYEPFLTGLVVDRVDAEAAALLPLQVLATDILMRDAQGRRDLAKACLQFCRVNSASQ